MKFEIYDSAGNLISTIPGNKRRGLNRIEWSMRAKAPKVPPAAGLVPNFFSLVGPRVPAGTYTVKMIKGKETYTSQLEVVPDPRAKHTTEDRALQHATVVKLYDMLGQLTYLVETIADTRAQANQRLSKISESDSATRKKIEDFARSLETLRAKIVATKEGGGITGEEKLREQLGDLYGAVNGYDGRPTQSQINRLTAFEKELATVAAEFEQLATKNLSTINAALTQSQLDAIKVMSKTDWENKSASQ